MGKDFDNAPDLQIWNEFQAGNELAYSFIYRQYTPVLFRYGLKLSSNRELVKDAIQDVFVYLWDARQRLSTTDNIKYYLFRVARRVIFAKTGHTEGTFPDTSLDILSPDHAPSYEVTLIEEQTKEFHNRQLSMELEHLPLRQREAVFLRFYDNMEFEEIARLMNINQRGVYKLIYKAVHALQKNMVKTVSVITILSTLLLYPFL